MKNFKIILHYFLFFIIATSCSRIFNMSMKDVSEEEKTELKIIAKVAKKLKKEKKLNLCTIGSRNKKDYYIRDLGFEYFNRLTIDEMRELLIYLVNLFIENFNASEDFLSYVKTPYGLKNFQITIYLREKNGNFIPYPELSIGELYNNQLTYTTSDRENYKLVDIYKETYEEALEKLKVQEKNLLDN